MQLTFLYYLPKFIGHISANIIEECYLARTIVGTKNARVIKRSFLLRGAHNLRGKTESKHI